MLSQAHRRSIHTSLTPILGEEETDALMSEFHASESDAPVTVAHFDSTIKDLRVAHKSDLDDFRVEVHDLFRKMTMQLMVVICSSLVGGMVLSAAIAAGIAQAVGSGGP